MSPDDADLDARGFTPAELLKTASQAMGDGVEALLDPPDRFLVNAARTVKRRVDSLGEEDVAVIFVFCEGDERPGDASVDEPLLRQGHRPLGSHIWFIGEIATGAKGIHVHPWDDAGAFHRISASGYGQQAALVFNPSAGALEAYPDGVDKPGTAHLVSIDDAALTMDAIFATIETAHNDLLAAPLMAPPALRLWKHAGKYHPAPRAEDRVQAILYLTLWRMHPNCDVRFEQPGKTGRVDLEVHVRKKGINQPLALLELKVLRSFWADGTPVSAAETDDHVKDGVEQAASYGDERGFTDRALCCFDMRKSHTGASCFSHVLELAKKHAVRLCVWPVFNAVGKVRPRLLAKEVFGESPAVA